MWNRYLLVSLGDASSEFKGPHFCVVVVGITVVFGIVIVVAVVC